MATRNVCVLTARNRDLVDGWSRCGRDLRRSAIPSAAAGRNLDACWSEEENPSFERRCDRTC